MIDALNAQRMVMMMTNTTEPNIFDEGERTLCVICGKADDCDCDTTPQGIQQKCRCTSATLRCKNNPLETPMSIVKIKLHFLRMK